MPTSCAALSAIAHYAKVTPQAPALIEPDGLTFSYKDLWGQIEAASRRLREAGIHPGQKVAILLPQGVPQVLAVLGALHDHVAVPLQARTTTAEVESHLRRMSISALITSQEFIEEAEAGVQSGTTVVMIGKGESPDEWQIRDPHVLRSTTTETSGATLFLVTSATTGNSKVVPLTALNLDAGIRSRCESLHLTDSDRLLLMTSMCHIIGIENALAQFLVRGAVISTRGFDPASYLSWLTNLRPTWYDCAPTVHQAALVQLKAAPRDLPISLRFVQSAGGRLPDEVRHALEQILRVPVFNDYGMTEACPIAVDVSLAGRSVLNSAGRSIGLEIGIMTPSGGMLLAGEEGEIVVRGDAVFSGYYDDPEATRAAFQNGWFRTGDLGRLDQDGNLYVTGRLKEMINRGGEKILPGEVDAAFDSHPSVLEAAAFAIPHPTLGEDVACAVVLREEDVSQVSARDLRRHAAQSLASFKIPHRIHFVDEIPRGELGKPQRWVLTERLRTKNAAPPTPDEIREEIAANGIVIVLHEIWSRILGREDLGFDEDFFEAGGDSLAALNMLAEVDQRYDSQTSAFAANFIDEPTLKNLGLLVGTPIPPFPSGDASSDMQIFPVRDGGSGVHLFCFPPDAIEGLPFRRLARHLSGEMSLSIVRPATTWYSQSLFAFENSAAEALALIRRVQPQGPYFLCGYCSGGVVAVEAARELSLVGQEARVILVETLVPGFPGFLRDWRIWAEAIGRQCKRLWTSEHPGLIRNLKIFGHRLGWSTVLTLRRLLHPVKNVPAIRWLLQWAQDGDYPVYKVRPLDAPCLHFLSADEPSSLDAIGAAARFGWKSYARSGIEEQYVAFDHHNVFHELNMPKMAEVLKRWCGAMGSQERTSNRKN